MCYRSMHAGEQINYKQMCMKLIVEALDYLMGDRSMHAGEQINYKQMCMKLIVEALDYLMGNRYMCQFNKKTFVQLFITLSTFLSVHLILLNKKASRGVSVDIH